jgi:nitroimidazol reductase NimA-like FMN-containing flavoprotein (pyridoxamine 5'-phosphate oxidase superfamily)
MLLSNQINTILGSTSLNILLMSCCNRTMLMIENTEELASLIKRIFSEQRFAVLATQSDGQPYCNLVAFTEADNLKSLIFVTSRDTRKYANIQVSKKVAILIDSRINHVSDFNSAVAVTALGTIEEVIDNKKYLSEIYLSKHPELKDFCHKPSNALMKIAVTEYIVATFEGVRRLRMLEPK